MGIHAVIIKHIQRTAVEEITEEMEVSQTLHCRHRYEIMTSFFKSDESKTDFLFDKSTARKAEDWGRVLDDLFIPLFITRKNLRKQKRRECTEVIEVPVTQRSHETVN